jgi:hypothetical protein
MNQNVVVQKPHVALTLLELANWLSQGRLVLPGARFQEIDSRSGDTISFYRAQVFGMFGGLPFVDGSESQSFFVARVRKLSTRYLCETSGIEYVTEIEDLEALFPVSEDGAQIFKATERIPGVVLHNAIFDSIWNDFFLDRHAFIAVNTAYDFARRFLSVERPIEGSDRWDRLTNLVKAADPNLPINDLDPLGQLYFRVIRYRRPTDRPDRYNDESVASVFADFFRCALDDEETELRNECRRFHSDTRGKPEATIRALIETDEFRKILKGLEERFGADSESDLIGVLFFLLIRLHKQQAHIRKLAQLAGFIQENPGFPKASVGTALVLLALSEEPDVIGEFVHAGLKASYGLFTVQPVAAGSIPYLIPPEFWLAPAQSEPVDTEPAVPQCGDREAAEPGADRLPIVEAAEAIPEGVALEESDVSSEVLVEGETEVPPTQNDEKQAGDREAPEAQPVAPTPEKDKLVSTKSVGRKKKRSRKKQQTATKDAAPEQIGIDSIPPAESDDE